MPRILGLDSTKVNHQFVATLYYPGPDDELFMNT